MIAPNEMLALKQRMLIAADAAYRIASTSEQFVLHDQEQFELVMGSLLALKADVRRLMAEHDILRGMFSEKLSAFFMEGLTDGSTGCAEAVEGVPRHEDLDRGEEKRDDTPSSDGPVLGVETPRKRAGRSNARGNRKGNRRAPVNVERGAGEESVDGGQDS